MASTTDPERWFAVPESDLELVMPFSLDQFLAEAHEHFDADLGTEFRYGPGTWLH